MVCPLCNGTVFFFLLRTALLTRLQMGTLLVPWFILLHPACRRHLPASPPPPPSPPTLRTLTCLLSPTLLLVSRQSPSVICPGRPCPGTGSKPYKSPQLFLRRSLLIPPSSWLRVPAFLILHCLLHCLALEYVQYLPGSIILFWIVPLAPFLIPLSCTHSRSLHLTYHMSSTPYFPCHTTYPAIQILPPQPINHISYKHLTLHIGYPLRTSAPCTQRSP